MMIGSTRFSAGRMPFRLPVQLAAEARFQSIWLYYVTGVCDCAERFKMYVTSRTALSNSRTL